MKPRILNSARLSFPLAAALAAMFVAPIASAQTNGTWDGGGTSAIWGGNNNWNPNGQIATGAGATATFGTAFTSGTNIQVNTNRTIGNINHNSTTTDITISQINSSVFTLDVTTGSPTVTVGTAARTLTITAPISGNDGMTKAGAGTCVLSGLNLFSGDVTVTGGTLVAGIAGTGGNSAFGGSLSSKTITANSSTTLRFDVGNVFNNNFSSASTSLPVMVIAGTMTNGGTATNSALGDITLNSGTLTATLGSASGYGSWNLNGTVTSTGTSTLSTSAAVPFTLSAAAGTTTTFDVQSGTLTASAALGQVTAAGDERISSLNKIGAGTMVLTSADNSYTGATTVGGGTLELSGSGSINTSSDISINGADAKLLQAGATAITPVVTLTQGTLTGSGTVNTVNVGDATGGVISNNNGVAGAALTIGNLTFNGAATVNTFGNVSTPIVTTSLATNAAGLVTINPTAASWGAGTYDLITYGGGSIGGAGFPQFQLGTVTGASQRQNPTLGNSGTAITLTVGADDPLYWVGDGDGKWNPGSTNNWKLSSNNSYTTFLASDNVFFNDSATGAGPISVDIDTANVAPTTTTFNNPAKDYVLGSTGGFGISSGSLIKSGAGTLTITNANSYTGNTLINGGVLDVSTDGAQLYSGATGIPAVVTVTNGGVLVVRNYGQGFTTGLGSTSLGNLNNGGGQVVLDGGTLRFNNETGTRGRKTNIGAGGGTLDVVNNSALVLNSTGNFIFSGADTLTLTGDSTSTGTIQGVISGSGVSLVKNGGATWTLSGANTFTGDTTINSGILAMSGNRITGSPNIFIGNGATLRSTGTFILAANQNITGTGATGNLLHSTPGTSNFQTTGGTTISTSGTLNFSRIDVRGLGNVIASGAVQSGGAASGQRGLLVGNTVTGDLTLNAGASLTTGASGSNAQDILGNGTATGTFIIDGGTYTNTAGLATLQLGNNTGNGGGTLTLNSGSASIGTLVYQVGGSQSGVVNLNGGTFTLGAMTSNGVGTREFNFDGGQFVAGGGVTFPADVTANVKDGGAKIDTNGFSATIASPMLNAGTGGLIKSGLGTLTLAGTNTYTGGTSVTAGSLRFSTAAASATDVTVAGGAEAGALVAADDAQWINTGDLVLQNNAVALVDYGSTTPSVNFAPVSVADFTFGSTPGVKLAGGALASLPVGPTTYPLVTWTGTGPTDASVFSLRTHRLSGIFSIESNTLKIQITGNAIGAISWKTGNGGWDTTSSNWQAADLTATTYFDALDSVVFGDATGVTGNPVVTLNTAFSPLSVTMDTTGRNYTVTGTGSIGGSGGLTLPVTNAGTFTLSTANNTFSGGTSILGGTLALGHATDTLPDSGTVDLDGATSVLNLGANNDTVGAVSLKNGASITGTGTLTGSSFAFESGSVAANLGGSGNLTKTTAATVTLSGNNSYTGNTTVSDGTLILSGANTTTGNTSLSTGATLILGNTAAVQNNSGMSLAIGTTLHLATDTAFPTLPTFGASSGASPITLISDRATLGAGLVHSLGTPNLGGNTFNFVQGANVDSGTAGFTLGGIGLTAGAASTTILNPSTATVAVTGTVSISANSAAKTLELSGTNTGNQISGDIVTNLNTLSVAKSGTGTWTLSGANTYNGTTTIDEGTLVFATTDQSLPGGLTFGAANGGTNVGTLDLSSASATFAGPALVRTNNITPNTITIGATRSLTLNGGLTMGYDAGGGTGATNSNLTVSGAGSLAINGATINVSVNQAATNAGYWSDPTLDVSGLANFSADVTTFNIGVGSTTQGPGTVLLSDTANTIIATTLTAGNTGGNNGRGTGLLVLGAGTNVIQADTINIGRSKSVPGGPTGMIRFASQDPGSPGTVTIGDRAGTGRANIDIAIQGGTATGGGATGTLDLRGHVATVSAGTLNMGSVSAGSNSGGPNGTLSFDAGTFDVNTLTMATKSGGSTGTARATVNIGGGTFTVNTAFNMGSQTGGGASNATVNLTGGTLTSFASIVKGTGSVTSTINLNGGTLDLNGNAIGSATEAITLNAESGTLKNVASINGTGGLTKTTAGTLVVEGTNPYSGNTTVTEGILTLSNAAGAGNANTLNDASSVNIAATGATLNLAYTGTDVVNELYIGGVLQAPGVWGGVGSGAPKTDPRITGPGTLTVTTGAAGFTSWITGTFANGIVPEGLRGPNDDPDNDGIKNLIEYAIAGQDPTVANSTAGTYTGTSLSFDKRQPLASDITYAIQQSTDLGLLDSWEEVSGGTYINNSTTISYTFTPGSPAKEFYRLSVTQNP